MNTAQLNALLVVLASIITIAASFLRLRNARRVAKQSQRNLDWMRERGYIK